MLTSRFDEAFRVAHELNRDQLRKGTSIPYISHLMGVAGLVLQHGGCGTKPSAGCCMMHPGDQGGAETLAEIRRRFGSTVVGIVADCSDAWTDPKPEWRSRKEAYIERLAHIVSYAR